MCNNILAESKYACSGCGACAAVCPQKAVSLKLNKTGFFTAILDSKKCINCGICKKVCTRYDTEFRGANLREVSLYALQSKSRNTVKKCSSGGVAYELAKQAIHQGQKVVGVAYNISTNQTEHVVADQVEQIDAFVGSKYLQSNPERAFCTILNHTKKDREARYMVFGTPCQIAGFAKSSEIMGVRKQFLLVEIFCHGVPSYQLWNEQCKRIKKKLKVDSFDSVQFRYKKNDWHSYCLKVEANGKTFYGDRETTLFWQVFFENILLGDSCYQCRLRQETSMADIRLGDYWGKRFQHRDDGVSAVFACTESGEKAILNLKHCQVLNQLDAGDAEEMLVAQNMDGYQQQELHDKAMNVLRTQADVAQAIRTYRGGMSNKQRLKGLLLKSSIIIPDNLRIKLRKLYSNRKIVL